MSESKPWWKSLTVLSTLATILLMAAQSTIDTIGPGAAWAGQVAPYITALLAILGRTRAVGPLTK